MKILDVIQCSNLGGMEQATLRLLEGLKKCGHAVFLLSMTPMGALEQNLAKAGIPCEGVPYRGKFGWRSHFQLRKKIQEHTGDSLIMTGHNLSAFWALPTTWSGKRVLAIHFHHQGVMSRFSWRLLYRLALKRFDKVVFVSDFIRNEAEIILPGLKTKSETIYNPLPKQKPLLQKERFSARKKMGLLPSDQVVGNAGWLIKRKRFDIFLEVAASVARTHPKAKFLIAGDGEEKESLLQLAKNLKIAHRVKWLGWQQDMRSFYASLNVLLFNSDWDAFPTTPLEAMSYGVPVVASLINGGLSEIVNHPNLGFLASDHQVSLLTQKVSELLDNPLRANRMGVAGQRRVVKVCGYDTAIAKYARLLEHNHEA